MQAVAGRVVRRHVHFVTPMLNHRLDGFGGKLTSSTWGSIAKCLPDTAQRDISDLPARDVLP